MNHDIAIERLEDISREQTMIHTGVFVLLEFGKFVLSNVHHSWRGWRGDTADIRMELGAIVCRTGAPTLLLELRSGASVTACDSNDVSSSRTGRHRCQVALEFTNCWKLAWMA
jgi:hypothetical protein